MNDFSPYKDRDDMSPVSLPRHKQRAPSERNPHLVFAVQKHVGTNPHYDLRLEVRGILKSWAIPKGPSMDPGESRLAIEMESRPQMHENDDGKISKKDSSAGDLQVWDKGCYEPVGPGAGPSDRMVRGLRRGAIRFILHGKKLKGGFSLVQSHAPDQWQLTKRDDMYANDGDPFERTGESATKRTY